MQTLIAVRDKNLGHELRALFEKSGCEVHVAPSGSEAKDICDSRRIDFLISNGRLSNDVTGLQLAEAVKKKNPHTAQVLITGTPALEHTQWSDVFGDYRYLEESADQDVFAKCAARMLERHRWTVSHESRDEERADGVHEIHDLWFKILARLGRKRG